MRRLVMSLMALVAVGIDASASPAELLLARCSSEVWRSLFDVTVWKEHVTAYPLTQCAMLLMCSTATTHGRDWRAHLVSIALMLAAMANSIRHRNTITRRS